MAGIKFANQAVFITSKYNEEIIFENLSREQWSYVWGYLKFVYTLIKSYHCVDFLTD